MTEPTQPVLPEGVPNLNTFYFYLTHGCNLACRHCWLAPEFQKNGRTGGHLDFEILKQAVEEAIPLGLSSAKLTGGEPLLHPDFVKIVDYLAEKEIAVTIETNGMLMTRELASHLKQSSTWFVSVSIDGANPETHNSFRGVKGSFQKANQAVKDLAEVGFQPQVIMSIHRGNIDQIEDLIILAQELGAGSVKFNLIQSTGRGELMEKRHEILGIEELIETGKWVEDTLQEKYPISLFYDWPAAFKSINSLLKKGVNTCGIFNILGVLSEGHYAMCGIGVQIPELVYGQIGVDNLADVWANHPTLVKLREQIPAEFEGICGKCILKNRCLGSCIAQNYFETGSLTGSHWFCRHAEELGLFPVTIITSKP